MGLYANPVVKKFFVNKIESSGEAWGDYLLEIADIFSTFDGEDLDRELLEDRFSVISGRSPYVLRDVANFRDEFGAYGTYLGLFHIEQVNGRWKLFLSNATKHFLCSTEPNVEGFCRTQMALFQYPNGAGSVQHVSGTAHMQSNIKADTVREIQYGIKINPLRLVCKIVVVLHKMSNIPLHDIRISYQTIFMLMNDDRINCNFSPDSELLHSVLQEYKSSISPAWATSRKNIAKFKRNFHIFERTGLFRRYQNGLIIMDNHYEKTYSYIHTISNMTHDFHGFDSCYSTSSIESDVISVVISPAWGRYFDAFTMPMETLIALSDNIDINDTLVNALPIGNIPLSPQLFPELKEFQADQIRAFSPNGNWIDPYETIIRREKANREHARILNMLAANFRAQGYNAYENTFIDLYADINGQSYIFEVKSNNSKNVLSQIRKAVAQLYEYRYRSEKHGAVLCIVLQQRPLQEWAIDYLINDREILLCWLVDDIRLECPTQCHAILSSIGVVS